MGENQDPFEALHERGNRGLLSEILAFLKESRKYWMIPLIIVLLLAGLLIVFSGSTLAPFIYPLF